MQDEPLYKRIEKKDYPTIEIMDRETLDWIRTNSESYAFIPLPRGSKLSIDGFNLVVAALPKKEWFASEPHFYSIHGISHIARETFIGALLCQQLSLGVRSSTMCLLAGAVHDLRRQNDNQDLGHGFRAATWLKDNKELFRVLLGNFLNDDQFIEDVASIVSVHETDYELIPEDMLNKLSKEIDIVKAADALDRFRQPKIKWWPDTQKIRIVEAWGLLGVCREFTLETEKRILNGGEPRNTVIAVAQDILLGK